VPVREQRFVPTRRCAVHDRRPRRFARARARVTRRPPLIFSLGVITTYSHCIRVFYAHAAPNSRVAARDTRIVLYRIIIFTGTLGTFSLYYNTRMSRALRIVVYKRVV